MERGQYSQPISMNGNGKHPQPTSLTYQPQLPETDKDDLNLRQLLTMMRRRILIIVGVTIAVTSAIGFSTLRQKPVYQSRFQLLVEPVTSAKLSQLQQLAAGNPDAQAGSALDYDTQIQVLRSPKLMSPIVDKINARCENVSYDSLISSNQLVINRLGETKILDISYRDLDPQKIECVLKEIANGYIQYSQEERQSNVNQGIRFVEAQIPQLRQRVDKLQGQLQVFRQQYNLLDPQTQAADLSSRFSGVGQERQEITIKLNELKTLYATLQNQLGVSQNQAIATSALTEAPRYQALLNQLQEIETRIAIESARFTPNSPTIQALQDQRRNLEPLLRQEAGAAVGNTVPEGKISTVSPNSIRQSQTQQLVEVANQIQVLEVRAAAIAQAETLLARQVQQLPVIARQYTDLQRELNVATESFNRFLGVRETLQIEAAQKGVPWQILLPPNRPQVPISPDIERNIILGIVAGLILGMAAALLIEKLDNVYHSLEDLKDSIRLPILGVIPFNKQIKQMTPVAEGTEINSMTSSEQEQNINLKNRRKKPQWYNASPFLEAFRSLHTNISFLSSDTSINSIVVSSATPGDGKSTTSTNLAQAAAAMGKRVLLVDADMRRPQVHHILGLPNEQGLSNVIATDVNPKTAMQVLPMWDNLYVLTAGQVPPDPTRLLSSQKMYDLMEQFKANFDLVIYDTPPVLGLADGRLLATHTNGIVLVVSLGKTDRSVVAETLDLLKISATSVLGIVANGVKGKTSGSYYYYQSYYTQESDVQKAKKLLQKGLENRE